MKKKRLLFILMSIIVICLSAVSMEVKAQPWILISSCDIEGGGAVLGEENIMHIELKNTNKKAVSNVKLSFVAEADDNMVIALSSGVQSQYVGTINASEEISVEIKFVPDASLSSGKYPVTIKVEYQYDGVDYEYKDNVVIPVTDEADISITDIQIAKATLMVTEEVLLTCNINNTGNCPIYNVTIFSENEYVDATSSYVGTIKQGETCTAELKLIGESVTGGKSNLDFVVQYETQERKKYEETESVYISVIEYTTGDYRSNLYSQLGQLEQGSANMSLAFQIVIKILLIIIILAAMGTAIYFFRKKYKKTT